MGVAPGHCPNSHLLWLGRQARMLVNFFLAPSGVRAPSRLSSTAISWCSWASGFVAGFSAEIWSISPMLGSHFSRTWHAGCLDVRFWVKTGRGEGPQVDIEDFCMCSILCRPVGNFFRAENHAFRLWFQEQFSSVFMQDLLNPIFGVNYGTSKGAAGTSRRAA